MMGAANCRLKHWQHIDLEVLILMTCAFLLPSHLPGASMPSYSGQQGSGTFQCILGAPMIHAKQREMQKAGWLVQAMPGNMERALLHMLHLKESHHQCQSTIVS